MDQYLVSRAVTTEDNPASLIWRIQEAIGRQGLAPNDVRVVLIRSDDWPGRLENQR
jgi:hypothetical protein